MQCVRLSPTQTCLIWRASTSLLRCLVALSSPLRYPTNTLLTGMCTVEKNVSTNSSALAASCDPPDCSVPVVKFAMRVGLCLFPFFLRRYDPYSWPCIFSGFPLLPTCLRPPLSCATQLDGKNRGRDGWYSLSLMKYPIAPIIKKPIPTAWLIFMNSRRSARVKLLA